MSSESKYDDWEALEGDDDAAASSSPEPSQSDSYAAASSSSSSGHVPLHLPMYQLCWDDVRSCHYLFHPCTGHVLFIENGSGDASQQADGQTYACWTRPTTPFSSVSEMRLDVTTRRSVISRHLRDCVPVPRPDLPRVFRDRDAAALCLQSFVRRVRDVAKYRRKIRTIFEKRYDRSSYLHFFVNTDTGESQWHRPVGLGSSLEHDLPETDFYNEETTGEEYKEGHAAVSDETLELFERPFADGGDEAKAGDGAMLIEHFPAVKTKKPKYKYLVGPYCKRLRYVPGRTVTKALGFKSLKDSKTVVDEHGVVAFKHPREAPDKPELYGPQLPALDGLNIKRVDAEPYLLVRSAHERGADAIMDVMDLHSTNRHVILFGFQSVAKMDLAETEDGSAQEASVRAFKLALTALDEWIPQGNMAVVSAAMCALATVSDNYANRIMLFEESWMTRVARAMKLMEVETADVYIKFPDGVKKMEISAVTRHSLDIAMYGCKILFNMACDEANREYVADAGTALVLYVMKYCHEDASVQHQGCLALYNFVYRNEHAHFMANEDKAMDVLNACLDNFSSDDNLRRACKRAIAAMEFDGWRGNLSTKFDDSKL